ARLVIANESFARDLGARFGVYGSDNFNRWITSGSIDSNQGAYGQALDPDHEGGITFNNPLNFANAVTNGGSLALTILGNYVNWDLEISALQREGRGEVVPHPRIATSHPQEAVVRQRQAVGYLTVTGGQSSSIPTVEFKDVLLALQATPTITHDGRVFLTLALTKDGIDGCVSIGSGL